MKDSTDIIVSLILLYQEWCSERIVDLDRAKSVVSNLSSCACCNTKTQAVDWLMSEDWSEKKVDAKRLVDALWKVRDDVIMMKKLNYIKNQMG